MLHIATIAMIIVDHWPLGAAGVVLGLIAGWGVGRINARRTTGPRERSYVRRTCFVTGTLLGLFLASAVMLPAPQRFIVPALMLIVVPAFVYRWSVRRQLLRRREELERQRKPSPAGGS